MIVIYVIYALIGIGLIIFIHEAGHFMAAKKVGVRVERFAIGFDPPFRGRNLRFLTFKRGETEYVIGMIPFGGYVKMAGETLLAEYELFHSVAGSAEMTNLAADSIDFIVAAQAFHWFEPVAARREFERILKPGGWVVAIRNMRRTTGSPFSVAYEKFLLRWGTDYSHVASLYGAAGPLGAFFADGGFEMDSIYSEQILDYEALEGRLLSSSYIPRPDDPDDSPLLAALREMYVDHERRGTVTMEYDTQIFYGRLD